MEKVNSLLAKKKFGKAYALLRVGDVVVIQKKGERNPEEETEIVLSKTEGKLTTFYGSMFGYLPRETYEILRVVGHEENAEEKFGFVLE
ncbi:hypothetical protein ISTM_100 [Insectomime virus]|uniref:HIRAN domain-containing protein n=1 Tax=Tunisvirus fontaine2 TaxID=1421067 RepID=V9SF45_9VIRU|nr:hypothetical protein D1R32_gp224 [Tunisvirus fontaine2]AHA45998.1 hypothetical protein ISTM_100 [Insectomime virus]AHC54941.1 hypothetical protein TNS_ORF223 [Tunisvirus fontaine2]